MILYSWLLNLCVYSTHFVIGNFRKSVEKCPYHSKDALEKEIKDIQKELKLLKEKETEYYNKIVTVEKKIN